ncbi:cell envelope integrity protein TolA [Desulfovibrio sp.]|uniref:cell envelope integrity protein TolA n=1 Tax=Desulfovibrio sp. TaxID=885 RepID=UPI0035ADD7CC
MRLASYVLSFCLHAAIFLLIWFWPSRPPIKLDTPPVMISLVEGATGGNRTPSPILGHMGQPGDGPMAPTPPAPKAEVAAPERAEVKEPKPVPPQPKQDAAAEVKKPEPKPEPKPQPKPEPKEEAKPIAQKKEDKPKPKEEHPKEQAKDQKKPEPPKADAKKDAKESKDAKSNVDPVAAALQQARKATSRAESGDRGNAVEQALAQAQRRAGGNRGGGGGEGTGPGGGGLGDVYMGQVMLAVRPNWGFASAGRVNLRCIINVRVDGQGKLLQNPTVTHSSGNSQFDSSAVNAIVRTAQSGQFPPPPSADYGDLDLVFTLDELMGR